MIENRRDLYDYLADDAKNYNNIVGQNVIEKIRKKIRWVLTAHPGNDQKLIWEYIYALRNAEYSANTNKKFLRVYWFWKMRHLSYKLGYQIPINVFDKGLTIFHWGSIIINSNAKIGRNCMLQPQITIGQKKEGEAPIIGDNCYIGSGARIIGRISIGDNVTIAPNAIITKDMPSNCVVGGVNQIIKMKNI